VLGVAAGERRELGFGVGAGRPFRGEGDGVLPADAGEVAAGGRAAAAAPGARVAGAPWEVSVMTTATTAATDSSAPADVATPARKLVSSSWV
jgi:hypothetical protein